MNEASGGKSPSKTKVLMGAAALVVVVLLGWLFIGRDGGKQEPEEQKAAMADVKPADSASAEKTAAEANVASVEEKPAPAAVVEAVEKLSDQVAQAVEEAAAPVAETTGEAGAAIKEAVQVATEAATTATEAVSDAVEKATPAPQDAVAAAVDAAVQASSETDLAQTKFDLFRAEQDGSIVVAGQADPNSKVELFVDGQKIGEARASSSGEYSALLDAGAASVDRMLTLKVTGDDGVSREGSESIVVAASDSQAPVVVADAEGARVLDGVSEQFVIDTLAEGVSANGGVISGRGAPNGALLRAYLDNAEVGLAAAAPDGRWRIELPKFGPGAHVLRVDALDADGKVIARAETEVMGAAEVMAQEAETPKAETPASPASAGEVSAVLVPVDQQDQPPSAGVRRVTIKRGNTLWAIARETYGDGFLYVRVFEANRDQIRDPDLIYPGQVFDLPK